MNSAPKTPTSDLLSLDQEQLAEWLCNNEPDYDNAVPWSAYTETFERTGIDAVRDEYRKFAGALIEALPGMTAQADEPAPAHELGKGDEEDTLAYLITAKRFQERGLLGPIGEAEIEIARPMARFLIDEGYSRDGESDTEWEWGIVAPTLIGTEKALHEQDARGMAEDYAAEWADRGRDLSATVMSRRKASAWVPADSGGSS